jgi:hypothetical protein
MLFSVVLDGKQQISYDKKVNITLLGFLFNILIIRTIRKNKKEVDVFRFVRDNDKKIMCDYNKREEEKEQ